MNETYYNSAEYKAQQEKWLKEIEEEDRANEAARLKEEADKRQSYLSKAGPFDPYTFMQVAGWKVITPESHVFAKHPTNKDLDFTIVKGDRLGKPGFISVRVNSKLREHYEKGIAREELIPTPKSPDELYAAIEKLGIMKPTSTEKAELERKYVVHKISNQ
jgi:hypothetical protein